MKSPGLRLAAAWLARTVAWLLLLAATPIATLKLLKLMAGMFQLGDAKATTMAAGILAIAWAVELRGRAEVRRQAAERQARAPRGFEVVRPPAAEDKSLGRGE